MAIIRRIPWTTKPSHIPSLNYGHPSTKGLILCMAFTEGVGDPYELVQSAKVHPRRIVTGEIDTFWSVGREGRQWDFDDALVAQTRPFFDLDTLPGPPTLNSGDGYSRLFIGETTPVGANPGLWREGATSSGDDFDIITGTTFFTFFRVGGTNVMDGGDANVMPTAFGAHCLTFKSGDCRVYTNGTLLGNTTTTASFANGTEIHGLNLQADSEERIDGKWSFLAIWNRDLSSAEVQSLSNNPYQLLQPRTQIIPIEVAAVGGRIMSSLAYSGGLAHKGGIAGKGGGLAG